MTEPTRAQKKLISYLRQRDPKLSEKDIPPTLNGIKRFVKVVQKIYTEPQSQITIKEVEKDGKKIKQRIITTEFEEFKKATDKTKKQQTLKEVFGKIIDVATKK